LSKGPWKISLLSLLPYWYNAAKEHPITKVLYPFGLIVAAGYLWRLFEPGGLDRHRVRHALNMTVLHFFLPALAFGLIATAKVDQSFFAVPLTAAAVTLVGLGAGAAAYRWLPWFRTAPRAAIGVLLLSSAFGNVTYLGLPVITETLGTRYGYIAILYDLLATTPVLLTVGMLTAARFGSGEAVTLQASLKRVLRLPPLWGVVLGIAAHAVPVPKAVLDASQLMGRAVIPVMIFTVGLALDFQDIRRLPVALPALAFKLLLAPVLAWLFARALGMTGDILQAVVIEGAMPVMVLSLVLADEFELDVPLAATCIAASTVASFFTLPLMMKILS
jgi:malate permease and related proteins